MATIRGGDKLEAALADMAKRISKPGTLRVGFLENATYPDGKSVAMVAFLDEYGHTTPEGKRVGPWPFFRNMIAAKKGGWPRAIATNLKAQNYDATKTLLLVGEGISGQLRQSIKDTNSPRLAESTIDRKGHAKPLVDSGVMLGSVDYEVK